MSSNTRFVGANSHHSGQDTVVMVGIADVPIEILEIVFRHLDGGSFGKVPAVCKKWQQVSRNLEKTFWRQACLKEIDTSILEEVLGYRYVGSVREVGADWKSAYRSWYLGCKVQNTESSIMSFLGSECNPITCVKISGSWIVTGHRSGSVYGWNQSTGIMCHVFIQHLVSVNDFALVDVLHSGPYGSLDNPWEHHHIISISKDQTVQVNSLLAEGLGVDDELQVAHYHSCGLDTIRIFGNLAAVSSSDNTILVFELDYVKIPDHRLTLALVHKVIGPREILWSFGFWHDEFQCFCVTGVRKVFSASDDKWKTIVPHIMAKTAAGARKALRRTLISGSFLARDKIVVLITVTGTLLVSIDGENFLKYPSMPAIKTSVVCIALYGSVLALGTETGHLLLYHVPRVADFLCLNLTQPAWSRYLSEASVIAVDVGGNESSPIVVACTTETMYVIKWQKNQNITSEASNT